MSDVRDRMQETARAIQAHLPPHTGFILLAFDFGDGDGRRLEYISNGKRADCLAAMREWIEKSPGHWGHEPETPLPFHDGRALTLEKFRELQDQTHKIELNESERQMVLRSLAHAAVEAPGFNAMLSEIALKMDNQLPDGKPQMFEQFKSYAPKERAKQLLQAAHGALRSYQFGNGSPDLAEAVADKIEAMIR